MVALEDRGRPSPHGAKDFKILPHPNAGENIFPEEVTFMPEVSPLMFSAMTRGEVIESLHEDGRVVGTRYNSGGPHASIDWQMLCLKVDGLPNLSLQNASVEIVEDPTVLEPWKAKTVVVTLPQSIRSMQEDIAGFLFSGGKCEPVFDTNGPKGEVVPLRTPAHESLSFDYGV